MSQQNLRKGSLVKFKIGRGTVTGKIVNLFADGKIAEVKSEGRPNVTRKIEKLERA